jgi:hypothetical protein
MVDIENEEFICYFDNIKHIFKSVNARANYDQDKIYHHNEDIPSHTYKCNEKIMSQVWFKNNKIHRDGNLPAFIDYEDKYVKYYKHGNKYENFELKKLINIQRIVKIFYFFCKNKMVWSPNYLGGRFIKKQLLKLVYQ